jgi:flagellar biogenesis protein FliO
VAVAYYTTAQRRWEMKNIFEKNSTWSAESQMGLALAIIPSIIYMVSKMFLILT